MIAATAFFGSIGTLAQVGIQMAGATGASTTGVTTNQGLIVTEVTGSSNPGQGTPFGWGLQAGTTYHLIANPRHITLIAEGRGVVALWEHTYSEVHQFLDQIPMVQFCQYGTAGIGGSTGGSSDQVGNQFSTGNTASSQWPAPMFVACSFNTTNISSGTTFGAYNFQNMTRPFQPYMFPHQGVKGVSVSANGLNRNIVNPVMFNHFEFGYPTIYVTGVVPVYMCRGGIGSPGDVININGTDYIYFPVNTQFGLAFLTN